MILIIEVGALAILLVVNYLHTTQSSVQTTSTPFPTPTLRERTLISSEEKMLMEALTWTLSDEVYHEQNTSSGTSERYLRWTGVSSGVMHQTVFNQSTLDLVDVTILMQNRHLVRVPVLTTITYPDNHIDNLVLTTHISGTLQSNPLQKGALLTLTTADSRMVTSNGIDWEACSGDLYAFSIQAGEVFCEIGAWLDAQFESERPFWLFTLRALNTIPEGWFLTGVIIIPTGEIISFK